MPHLLVEIEMGKSRCLLFWLVTASR